MLTTGNKKFET